MVTVGVIGCGKIAQVRHLPEYASRENVVIKYVFDLCRELPRSGVLWGLICMVVPIRRHGGVTVEALMCYPAFYFL